MSLRPPGSKGRFLATKKAKEKKPNSRGLPEKFFLPSARSFLTKKTRLKSKSALALIPDIRRPKRPFKRHPFARVVHLQKWSLKAYSQAWKWRDDSDGLQGLALFTLQVLKTRRSRRSKRESLALKNKDATRLRGPICTVDFFQGFCFMQNHFALNFSVEKLIFGMKLSVI